MSTGYYMVVSSNAGIMDDPADALLSSACQDMSYGVNVQGERRETALDGGLNVLIRPSCFAMAE